MTTQAPLRFKRLEDWVGRLEEKVKTAAKEGLIDEITDASNIQLSLEEAEEYYEHTKDVMDIIYDVVDGINAGKDESELPPMDEVVAVIGEGIKHRNKVLDEIMARRNQ